MTDLPPLYACRLCGTEIDPNDQYVYQRVSGWAQNRKPSAIVLPVAEQGFACPTCVGTARLGATDTGQGALF